MMMSEIAGAALEPFWAAELDYRIKLRTHRAEKLLPSKRDTPGDDEPPGAAR